MCKKKSVLTFVIIMILLFSTALGGCSRPANSNSTASTAKKGLATYTELGTWPKPPLYQGNNFAAGGIGWPVSAIVYEGLYQFVRTTDYLSPRLAIGMPVTKGNETTVHLRHNVKWNDGKPFTSKDIWAYYTLDNGSFITKFLTSVETPDDYTVVFKWADPQPNDTVKKMLIGQENQATIPYHLFSKYVDKANSILSSLKLQMTWIKEAPLQNISTIRRPMSSTRTGTILRNTRCRTPWAQVHLKSRLSRPRK